MLTGVAAPTGGALGSNVQLAQQIAAARGWAGQEWIDLYNLGQRESGWNQFARNASSGAYGIAQALPESKYPFAGTQAGGSDPRTQINWMDDYIAARYGDPIGAYRHELSSGWYDQGGWAPPGASILVNNTGSPERIVGPHESIGNNITIAEGAVQLNVNVPPGLSIAPELLHEMESVVTDALTSVMSSYAAAGGH